MGHSASIWFDDSSFNLSQFLRGSFCFQKSNRRFSKIALDQVHQQHNEKIKDASGATQLLNSVGVSGLERWEIFTPEIDRIIESLEDNTEAKTTEDLNKPHHEDRSGFNVTLLQMSRKYMTALMLILSKKWS